MHVRHFIQAAILAVAVLCVVPVLFLAQPGNAAVGSKVKAVGSKIKAVGSSIKAGAKKATEKVLYPTNEDKMNHAAVKTVHYQGKAESKFSKAQKYPEGSTKKIKTEGKGTLYNAKANRQRQKNNDLHKVVQKGEKDAYGGVYSTA